MQIEEFRNSRTIARLDNPNAFACITRGSIQNPLDLKIQLVLRRTEPCLLKIPGQIKCLNQFYQQIVIAHADPKCCQGELPVQRFFAHISQRVRQ